MTRNQGHAIARTRRALRLGLPVPEPVLIGEYREWVSCPACRPPFLLYPPRLGVRCGSCRGEGGVTAETAAAMLESRRRQDEEQRAYLARRAEYVARVMSGEEPA